VTGSAHEVLRRNGSPLGLHRVIEPAGVLPQAAWRLDAGPAIWPDEVRVRGRAAEPGRRVLPAVAGILRRLGRLHAGGRAEHRGASGKMQNPVTGSGGMLTGVVEEAGPGSPLGLAPGDRIATLVSLSLTPLALTDGLACWDGQGEQVPCAGHAILFGRSIAAVLPDDLPGSLALAGAGRVRRARADRAGVRDAAARGGRRRPRGGDHRGPGQERIAVRGRRAPGRRPRLDRRRADRAGGGCGPVRPAWLIRW